MIYGFAPNLRAPKGSNAKRIFSTVRLYFRAIFTLRARVSIARLYRDDPTEKSDLPPATWKIRPPPSLVFTAGGF